MLMALCVGNSLATGEFPPQRPVTRSFDVFFDLHLNEWLSKQSRCWWFEMPSCSSWCHYNGLFHSRELSESTITNALTRSELIDMAHFENLFEKIMARIIEYHMIKYCLVKKSSFKSSDIYLSWYELYPNVIIFQELLWECGVTYVLTHSVSFMCLQMPQIESASPEHEEVIKWKHFPRYWPFLWGIHRSPVNSPHNGQWCGALMFSLICARINAWVNNREAGDLRCQTLMMTSL